MPHLEKINLHPFWFYNFHCGSLIWLHKVNLTNNRLSSVLEVDKQKALLPLPCELTRDAVCIPQQLFVYGRRKISRFIVLGVSSWNHIYKWSCDFIPAPLWLTEIERTGTERKQSRSNKCHPGKGKPRGSRCQAFPLMESQFVSGPSCIPAEPSWLVLIRAKGGCVKSHFFSTRSGFASYYSSCLRCVVRWHKEEKDKKAGRPVVTICIETTAQQTTEKPLTE